MESLHNRHHMLETGLLRDYLHVTNGSDTNVGDCSQLTNNDPVQWVQLLLKGKYSHVLALAKSQSLFDVNQGQHPEQLDSALIANVEKYVSQNIDFQNERQMNVLCTAVACLQLFVQNNWTGPPTEHNPAEILGECWMKHDEEGRLAEVINNALTVDGEVVCSFPSHLAYLYFARIFLLECRQYLSESLSCHWWLLRYIHIHQELLNERSQTLKATVMDLIETISKNEEIMANDEFRDLAVQFHTEAGHLCYFYYEPSQARDHFNQAEKLSALSICLTGEMGKRTRFQEKLISQLVLQVKHNDDKQPWARPADDNGENLPKNIALDDDTVLDNIEFIDKDKQLVDPMSAVQKAVVLGLCYRHRRSKEGQGKIVEEESLAFINSVLHKPVSWCVQSAALLMRSQWQWESMRRVQRSMAQLEELVNQLRRPDPGVQCRIPLIYMVKLPPIWVIQLQLAGLLEKVGAMNSALEVYLRIKAWEHVIRCYAHLGRKEKADALIRDQLALKETPILWCYLGDIHNDEQYYQKAWELSNGRFGRAQKSLALLYLHHKEFEKSLSCFEKSLRINSLQLGVWFSYGCAALACQRYDVAATAFRRCVSIDSDNFEAWCNLSTAYIRSNQKGRAFATLQEALKCEFENWRLWENFLLVATDLGEFEEAIKAYHRLLDLKEKHNDVEVLHVITRSITENLKDAHDQPARRLRPEALKLFGRITSKITSNADIWRMYAELVMCGEESDTQTDREKALIYLQKSHRSTNQAVNWEKDLLKCKDILLQSKQLGKAYLECCGKIEDSAHATQLLQAARLTLVSVLSKIKKHQVDAITGGLPSDLDEPFKELEEELTNVTQAIAQQQS